MLNSIQNILYAYSISTHYVACLYHPTPSSWRQQCPNWTQDNDHYFKGKSSKKNKAKETFSIKDISTRMRQPKALEPFALCFVNFDSWNIRNFDLFFLGKSAPRLWHCLKFSGVVGLLDITLIEIKLDANFQISVPNQDWIHYQNYFQKR